MSENRLMGCFQTGYFAPGYKRNVLSTDALLSSRPMDGNPSHLHCGGALTWEKREGSRPAGTVVMLFLLLMFFMAGDTGAASGDDDVDAPYSSIVREAFGGGCDSCAPLPAPVNAVINVQTAAGLVQAVSAANDAGGNRTIRIADGTYDLSHMLVITAPDITVRSAGGLREKVVLQGDGMSGGVAHIFLVQADRFTVADLSLGLVRNHGVQVQGERDADDLRVHNVRFFDIGEQMLKISYSSATPANRSERGVVRCSLFEYTAGIGPRYYIGGIDGHACDDWEVRDNFFRHIRSPESAMAEHAIHFWSGSANTLVERNVIVNCDRGIGFGLEGATHTGGLIRNNMVYTTRDVGIGLESSTGTRVLNNTVYAENYGNAIEYRWPATRNAVIQGNLTHGVIQSRDGGTGTVSHNYTGATAGFFVNLASGDMHLASAHPQAVDQAPPLAQVLDDMDCRARPAGAAPDLGAHEWGATDTAAVPEAPTRLTVD